MNAYEQDVVADIIGILDRVSDRDGLLADPHWSERLMGSWKRSHGNPVEVRVPMSGLRTTMTTAGSTSSLDALEQPSLSPFQRRLWLRDLMPSVPVTAVSKPFVRELSPVGSEQGASGTPETQTKNDLGSLQAFQSNVQQFAVPITATLTASQQILEDSPLASMYISNRLPYVVKVAEERGMLYGSGSGDIANAQMLGFFADTAVPKSTVSGVGCHGAVAAALQAVGAAGAQADAVLVNTGDLEADRVIAPTYWTSLTQSSGVRVVPTASIHSGQVLAGPFRDGAMVAEREAVSVQMYGSYADYAARGLTFIVAEERVSIDIAQPFAFAGVNWS